VLASVTCMVENSLNSYRPARLITLFTRNSFNYPTHGILTRDWKNFETVLMKGFHIGLAAPGSGASIVISGQYAISARDLLVVSNAP